MLKQAGIRLCKPTCPWCTVLNIIKLVIIKLVMLGVWW